MMSATWIILRKEVIDNLRDRRSLGNAALAVLFNPLFFILLFGIINTFTAERTERPLDLPVVGAENAPGLVAFLARNQVSVLPPPDDPEAAVLAGEWDVVLVIPDDYGRAFTTGEAAPVQVLADQSNQGSRILAQRTANLLNSYSRTIGNLRLLARGVSPEIASALSIERVDLSHQASTAGSQLSLLPLIIINAVFAGGLYLAVDTTAGERERGSLEPLLLNPVARRSVVLAKLASVLVFILLAVLLATGAFTLTLTIPVVAEFVGFRANFTASGMLLTFALALPVILLAGALQLFLGSYARSVKEASTFMQYLLLAPTIPAVLLVIIPVKMRLWMMAIPAISQLLLVGQVLDGQPLWLAGALMSAGVTVLVAGVFVVATVWLYGREQIVYGRA